MGRSWREVPQGAGVRPPEAQRQEGKDGTFEFLGRWISQDKKHNITVTQHDYVKNIKPIYVPAARRRTPNALATDEEVTKYKSLVQQMAWPARSTLPGLAYDVSDLQQRSKELTVCGLVRANSILRMAKDMASRGVGLIFPARGEQKPSVICAHDASFAQQPGEASQQGYLIMASDRQTTDDAAVMID